MGSAAGGEIRKLTVTITQEGKWFAVSVLEMPEIHTQVRTPEEAVENVRDAIHELREARKQLKGGTSA